MRFLIPFVAGTVTFAVAGCGTANTGGNTPPAAPAPPSGAGAAGAPPVAQVNGVAAGKIIFQAKCIACHGANGKGVNKEAPDFTDATWQSNQTDDKLLYVITNGHMHMPAFKDKLTEEERKDVLAYVRTLAPSNPSPGG